MGIHEKIDIRSLAQRRRPGYCLEAAFYRSPEVFSADLEVIFGQHWIFVAVEPDIPQAGDFTRVDIGGESIVIVRDDEDEVRAYHNVCRHRGARLVSADHGTVGKLVCPYHQWTYELTGELIVAPQMPAGFDLSCHGLKPVHLRSIGGLIFICLSDEPPADIEEMAEVLERRLAHFDLASAKVAAREDIIEDGNWKLTMDNNRECYHCDANHPELTLTFSKYAINYTPDPNDPEDVAGYEAYKAREAATVTEWERGGYESRPVEFLTGRPTGFRTERLPIAGSGESFTLDTKAACKKLMGSLTDAALGDLHIHTQPNAWFHFMADHGITFSVIPLSPEKTLVRTTWLVHKDAIEGKDYDVDRLTEVWRATNDQDGTLVGLTQFGVSSKGYEPGPYCPGTEKMCDDFTTWYIERIMAGAPALASIVDGAGAAIPVRQKTQTSPDSKKPASRGKTRKGNKAA